MSKYQEAFKRIINDDYLNANGNQYDLDVKLIEELVDKATWIPVEKKLPPMFTEVMITYEDNDFIPRRSLAYINESHEWIYPLMNNYKYRVIAWMPLPEPYLGSVR